MPVTDEQGRIIGDDGVVWRRDDIGWWSIGPYGYFIARLGNDKAWTLYRKNRSSYSEKVPFVRQIIARGTVQQCMHAAEIYDITRRV